MSIVLYDVVALLVESSKDKPEDDQELGVFRGELKLKGELCRKARMHERERCALIAERMGFDVVAKAIRSSEL